MSDRMRFSEMAGIGTVHEERQSIWPLNVVLFLLGLSVLGVAFAFLDTADARPLYNPWSYAIAAPIVLLLLSLVLSTLVSRVVEKSMQVAFLLSLLIHLVLMVAAVNVVIFTRMWPDVLDTLAAQREVLKREKLQAKQYHRLSSTTQSGSRPDYLKPVETEHQPTEVESASTPRLALARSERTNLVTPSPEIELSHTPHLLPRDQPATSTPSSTDQAVKLSRSDASTPRIDSSAPAALPNHLADLEAEAPAPLSPAEAALSRTNQRRSSELSPVPAASDVPLATSLGQSQPLEQRRELSAQEPTPDFNDLAVSLPRSTAGGALGAQAPSSMPVQGLDAVGVNDPLPSQEIVLGSQTAPQRRSSSHQSPASQLPLLGAPHSQQANELYSFSSGLSGRSPSELTRASQDGAAANPDVAGLYGAERDLQRSSPGRTSRPSPAVVSGLQAVQEQLAAE